ncbi:hypothetical protein NQZ68_025255 [Dissostichus eleginoides]|nr:hypothetical protein NQZ68_025255 [Dissostichus eleginoides]
MHPTAQIAVRASAPKPVLTVRPPTASCTTSIAAHPGPVPGSVLPQRVLLSPDMQARLPSGEVVSIAQLASLAGRPVSCQGSKPVTFQLQGNKLTLSGAQLHQVPAASPRPVQGNVMHLVTSGMQHHLISQTTQVTVQSAVSTSATAPASNRMPHNITAQVVPSLLSSPGVVKIVVRQTAGKDGGPVPTLAVAPSPRFGPLASLSPHPHTTTTPFRIPAPLQITQRTPGPATAHYTIAPPGNPSSTPNQPHPPRPILKVVQPPPPSTEQPAPVQVSSSSSASKPLAAPHESSNSSSQTPATTKSRPSAKPLPPPRRRPPPPPRSPFHLAWMADSQKQQRDSRLDFIIRVNENRCAAKPMYGREVLNFLTFLPASHPSPAPLSTRGEWGRSGHSSALYAQWQNKSDFWFQSPAVREAIQSIDDRLELLNPIIDRFTFAIPPVEARPISMHCCHPPPSLGHKQAVFSTQLSAQVTPLARSLHRIQCYTRTQFPDLRLIQYDCGKLQTLHTLLRKLKTGGHRVLIFTQMTRMLDVLEQFLNYHGHIYLRLDGSTRVEMRQSLMERFNADRRIFCFILSTRSGGVGVNLTGADTVVFYDSDWNPTMDAQAQDRCHRIGQTRDVHIYRLISERTVEENILKKANQKRMLGDMAIEGGNFTTAFFKEQTIRDLFDMNDGEKREAAVELTVSQPEEEEAVNKQSTTILEQALCRAEDEEDIVAASQAKAEQVAELAEFNENIPLDDAGEQEEVEELSKAEQEIAALVEQLTPIERYAMNFLEASLEDVCKEELKQAEEQVEAARKGLDQAKEEGLKLNASSDDDDNDSSLPASVEPTQPGRRGRKPKEASKNVSSTRTSGRLRGASPETEPEKSPTSPKEVPERLRCGLRRGAAKDSDTVSTTPSRTDDNKTSSSTRLQDSSKSSKASSPARDQHTIKTRTLPNRSHPSPVPSPPTSSPPTRKQPCLGETDSKTSKDCREEKEPESLPESSFPVDHEAKDYDTKDHSAMSPPSTSSRSPRKRQSADEEVLRGLVEDSPSAKVLRKLPGRLVTVVGEKEPRKRRRRGSGTGASSEEATAEENPSGSVEESNTKDNTKDNTSLSSDSKTKGAVAQFPQDQDSTPKPSVHHPPVRSYAPYSPAHLSPDMPVLRNLPVRRRLETESRMAAQLGEQLLSRGRGANQSRKTETTPGKDTTSTEGNVNSLAGNLKRKRGRPPKTPPRLPEAGNTVASSPQPTSQSEEGNPPNSPKRKRGRPRKDSTTSPETISEEQNSKNESTENDASKEPTVLSLNVSETPIADVITTSQDSQSTKAEEMDTKTQTFSFYNFCSPCRAQTFSFYNFCSPCRAQTFSFYNFCSSCRAQTFSFYNFCSSCRAQTFSFYNFCSSCRAQTFSFYNFCSPCRAQTFSFYNFCSPCRAQTFSFYNFCSPCRAQTFSFYNFCSSCRAKTFSFYNFCSSCRAKTFSFYNFCSSCRAQTFSFYNFCSSCRAKTFSFYNFCSPCRAKTFSLLSSIHNIDPSCCNLHPTYSFTKTQFDIFPHFSNNHINTKEKAVAVTSSPPTEKVQVTTPLETASPSKEQTTAEKTVKIPSPVTTSTPAPLPTVTTTTSPPEKSMTVSTTNVKTTQVSSTIVAPVTRSTVEVNPTNTVPVSTTQTTPDVSPQVQSSASSEVPTPAPSSVTSEKQSLKHKAPASKRDPDGLEEVGKTEAEAKASEEEDQDEETDIRKSQRKRRKVESSSGAKDFESSRKGTLRGSAAQKEEPKQKGSEQTPIQKRPLSRQSSQDSARSSSSSSGCSTLTRQAHHKRTYENRLPTKKRRMDVTSETGNEENNEEDKKHTSRGRRSRSSSSSDSDTSEHREEHRLTRSAKHRLQDQEREKSNSRQGKKPDRSASNNTNASTGGESGSDTSSVRITRKSAGSKPSQESKAQTNSAPLIPPEPEVLGKRCSALNAAAKLLAMKGRVDTPGHTTRKDFGAKAAGTSPASSDKNQKPKSKSVPASPQSNSLNLSNNKSSSSKNVTPNQTSHSASRSTRQRPGSLVPPLEVEYKRSKADEKDRGARRSSRIKEGEAEALSSSRGHSACSSVSSDGDAGGRSSRSRSSSSSNSSQRTRSISSQNTERRESRATSSGSERERDRSSESRDKRDRHRRESLRSHKLTQEVTSSSGAEGTPDRVLRSVAALAAVQARSPAASTRSSFGHHRHNKT